jgi:hypothetical protein
VPIKKLAPVSRQCGEEARETDAQQGQQFDVSIVNFVGGHHWEVVSKLGDVSIDGSRCSQKVDEAMN